MQRRCFAERILIIPSCSCRCVHVQIEGSMLSGSGQKYDYVVACKGLLSKSRNVEVIEEYDSRPHKSVRFEVRHKKEPQEVRIESVPKPLLGVSGGKSTFSGRQHARCQKCDEHNRNSKKCKRAMRNMGKEGKAGTLESNSQVRDPSTRKKKIKPMTKSVKKTTRTFSTS